MISFSRCNRFLSNEMRILYRNSLEKLKTCGESLTNTFIHLLGPLLIGLAVCLITLCTVIFFRVILPYYFEESTLLFYLTCIFSVYLVYCLSFHYYKSVTVTSYSSEDLSKIESSALDTLENGITERIKRCKKCNLPKPARAHHCRVCKRCILKMDHHCPWLHNCVGHFNHRYFVLFLSYISFACLYYGAFGWVLFMESIRGSAWSYPVDRFLMTFSVLVALALGVALFMMTLWHIYLICTGQTQIEYYGNNYMKWYGKSTGEVFINEFDVGWKGNLRIFFNISKLRPWYTILIPISVPSVGNGTVYPTYHDYDVNSIYDTLPLENIHIM